jgi:hypothetical protein
MKRLFLAPLLAILLFFGSAATRTVHLSASFESGIEEAATESSAEELQRATSSRKIPTQSSRAPRLALVINLVVSRASLGAYAFAQAPLIDPHDSRRALRI